MVRFAALLPQGSPQPSPPFRHTRIRLPPHPNRYTFIRIGLYSGVHATRLFWKGRTAIAQQEPLLQRGTGATRHIRRGIGANCPNLNGIFRLHGGTVAECGCNAACQNSSSGYRLFPFGYAAQTKEWAHKLSYRVHIPWHSTSGVRISLCRESFIASTATPGQSAPGTTDRCRGPGKPQPITSNCTSTGVQSLPLIGIMSCGQVDITTTQSINARSST